MKKTNIVVLSLVLPMLLNGFLAQATSVRIKMLEISGGILPDGLVIVESLDRRGEFVGSLSDEAGTVPTLNLTPGLYRVIGTCPYGVCAASVSEFLVGDQPIELELKLRIMPHGDGMVLGLQRITVHIVDKQDQEVPSARVIVRDWEAHEEEWYETNSSGDANVALPREGLVTIIVIQNRKVTVRVISNATLERTIIMGDKLTIQLD